MAKATVRAGKSKTNKFGASDYPDAKPSVIPTGVAKDKVTKAKTGKAKYMPTSKANQMPKKPRKTKRNSYQIKL